MVTVWGIAVGEKGNHLPVVNNRAPFPPETGGKGQVVIGWPSVGDMVIWNDEYSSYLAAFRKAYPVQKNKATQTNAANQVWSFAFDIKDGDLVICPCSSEGWLLIGEVAGSYFVNFDALPGKRGDFVHYRPVYWRCIINKSDLRYSKLNRIGQATVTKLSMTEEEIWDIIESKE